MRPNNSKQVKQTVGQTTLNSREDLRALRCKRVTGRNRGGAAPLLALYKAFAELNTQSVVTIRG